MSINQTYKNKALASLEGKWTNGVIATVIVFLVSGVVGNVVSVPAGDNLIVANGLSGIWSLLCLPLSWGAAVYFLNLIRSQDISYERLFDGYKDFIRIFLAGFLVGLCILVGLVLFIVPGIIIGLMFSMTSFVLKDFPEMSAADAMKMSKELTDGHKVELFWLTLSFAGWFVLSCLTLGLGFLALYPYFETTMAHYYEDLKADQLL
jgi:uncharacterized membrane protein